MTKLIPTEHIGRYAKHKWITYDDKVLLIRPDKNGNKADFQIDGRKCGQCELYGHVIAEAPANYRWFRPDWWYKKVDWYENREGISDNLFFLTRQYQRPMDKKVDGSTETWIEIMNQSVEALRDKAKPAGGILNKIIKRASKDMGIKLRPDFEETAYGIHWKESYVPVVTENNEKCILTWNNCD